MIEISSVNALYIGQLGKLTQHLRSARRTDSLWIELELLEILTIQ